MKILIACPVHNREWVLPYYLQHLHELDYDKKLIDIYWVVNNSVDGSKRLLDKFKEKYNDEYNSITIDVYNNTSMPHDVGRIKATRRKYIYHWLAELRNKLLNKCVELQCDFLLSCDCDILMRYDTITTLLSHKNPITAALILNNYDKTADNKVYTNMLNFNAAKGCYTHIQNTWIKKIPEIPKGKTIPVDFTGACILISKKACENSKYAYFRQGEDEPFCRIAKMKGFQILVDLSLFNLHIIDKDVLNNIYLSHKEEATLYLRTGEWKDGKSDR